MKKEEIQRIAELEKAVASLRAKNEKLSSYDFQSEQQIVDQFALAILRCHGVAPAALYERASHYADERKKFMEEKLKGEDK